jgi:hypothetical protein
MLAEQKVRRFLPTLAFLSSSELSGRMLLLIRRPRRMFNARRRPKTAARPSEQAEKLVKLVCTRFKGRVSLTIMPEEALGPTWFEGINGSGPGLSTQTMAPTRQTPEPCHQPPAMILCLPFSFQFQASGMALSCPCPLSFHLPWLRLPYSFENLWTIACVE